MTLKIKKWTKIAAILFSLLPSLAFAQIPTGWKDLIVCSGSDCNFNSVILFINNLINDLILISFPVAAVAFAWAGFTILTSGGSEEKKNRGKSILIKVAIGYAIIIGAYVVVTFITKTFLNADYYVNLLGG